MKKTTPYIDFRALFLAVLLLLAFGAKEAHHLLEHSQHVVKICDDTSQNETHIHGEEYLPHECQLCDFTFSIFDIFTPVFSLKKAKIFYATKDFNYLSYHYSRQYLFQSLRAPPFQS